MGVYMRTNIILDDKLVDEALKLTGLKTKRELIQQALMFLIKSKKRKNLSDLEGKIEFAKGYDHKTLRQREHK